MDNELEFNLTVIRWSLLLALMLSCVAMFQGC